VKEKVIRAGEFRVFGSRDVACETACVLDWHHAISGEVRNQSRTRIADRSQRAQRATRNPDEDHVERSVANDLVCIWQSSLLA